MPKALLKFPEVVFVVFISIILANCEDSTKPPNAIMKRTLLHKELEVLKTKPMSPELRSFIQRFKRNKKERRSKRSGAFEENSLYVVQNGNLVPVKQVKGSKRNDNSHSIDKGFTVVPLVLPVQQNLPAPMLNPDGQRFAQNIKSRDVAEVEPECSTTNKSNDSEVEDSNSADEDSQVLHKILNDVEGLMQWKDQGNKKEGVICNLNGSWISDAAGMRFDISYQTATRKKFRIEVADRIPPTEDGFLCDGNWTVFGEMPFQHSGLVVVLAVHPKDKHLATFIGECRNCDGSESVTGTWLVGRSSRDCKDQKESHKILSDVWRREQIHSLQKKHLLEIGYTESSVAP